jgi:CcmD family protein
VSPRDETLLRGSMRRSARVWSLLTPLLLTLLIPMLAAAAPLQTDAATLGAQNLRPYWHVFVAYTIAWLLVFGWLFSIARRLSRIERKLGG